MKRMILGIAVILLFISNNSFAGGEKVAGLHPHNYDAWTLFQNHQHDELRAFLKQLNAEKDGYLKAHPDVASQVRQQQQAIHDYIKKIHSKNIQRKKSFKAEGQSTENKS